MRPLLAFCGRGVLGMGLSNRALQRTALARRR
jgi:hypothetical protein